MKHFFVWLLFPLFCCLLSAAQVPQRAPAPHVPAENSPPNMGIETVQDNVVYAKINGAELHLDIYEPAGTSAKPRPVVILIHGGGWTAFDKSTMRGMGGFLSRSGFVAFSVDYRLFRAGENRWPTQLDDVQRAVRWIRANASKYSVDPDHIGAFGHSAGAQLAALLGMEDTRDNSDPAGQILEPGPSCGRRERYQRFHPRSRS
jgi:acetyl esterase/lipase